MKAAFAFLTDHEFFPGTENLINSMFNHCKELHALNDVGNIDWIFISDTLSGKIKIGSQDAKIIQPNYNYVNPHADVDRYKKTFYKFTLFDPIFQNYDLVYFFDSDLLCLSDFYSILPTNLVKKHGNFDFYACADNGRFINKIHRKAGRVFFNTGLFVFKPIKFKEYESYLLSQLQKTTIDGGEQPIINDLVQFAGAKFCQLQDSFNLLKRVYEKYPELYRITDQKFKIKFLHFVQKKPWNSDEPQNRTLWNLWHNAKKKHKKILVYKK